MSEEWAGGLRGIGVNSIMRFLTKLNRRNCSFFYSLLSYPVWSPNSLTWGCHWGSSLAFACSSHFAWIAPWAEPGADMPTTLTIILLFAPLVKSFFNLPEGNRTTFRLVSYSPCKKLNHQELLSRQFRPSLPYYLFSLPWRRSQSHLPCLGIWFFASLKAERQ